MANKPISAKLPEALTNAEAHGHLALYYTDDSLPSFLGAFIYDAQSEKSSLIDLQTEGATTATLVSGTAKSGWRGRWIIGKDLRVGQVFSLDQCEYVSLMPRYPVKVDTAELGQTLVAVKDCVPTAAPKYYIYVTKESFLKNAWSLEEYADTDLNCITAKQLKQLTKGTVDADHYKDPFQQYLENVETDEANGDEHANALIDIGGGCRFGWRGG